MSETKGMGVGGERCGVSASMTAVTSTYHPVGELTRLFHRAGLPALIGLLAVLLGVLHLVSTVGFQIASPSLPMWANPPVGDIAQAVLGAEAFLRDRAWHLPLAATDRLLADGRPLSIVYTDSTPWLAVAIKAAGLGVADISVTGLTLCLNFLLQPVAFVTLLLAVGVCRMEILLLGATLGSLLPTWYMRAPLHVALSSHWVILLALALAVCAARAERRTSPAVVAGLCALGALSLGIHAYLFAMVAAVAMGGLLADLAREGWRALPRVATGVAAFLAISAGSAWLLGYGVHGGGSGGFGHYSMNVLSPFVPQVSGVSKLLTGDPGAVIDATGGQYEGYNYFGAGVLLVLILAVLTRSLVGAGLRPDRPRSRRHVAGMPLLLALLALTMLALSNRVFVGHAQLVFTAVPWRALLDELRSSGRLFWPVAYALLALALAGLDKLSHRGLVAFALAVAVVLQIADTAILRRSLKQTYASSPVAPNPALDLWRYGPLAGHHLRLLPRFLCTTSEDGDMVRELSLVIVRAGGRIDGGPVARSRSDACADDQVAAITAMPHGLGDRVDVLLGRSLSPATLAIAAEIRQPCTLLAFKVLVCSAAALIHLPSKGS